MIITFNEFFPSYVINVVYNILFVLKIIFLINSPVPFQIFLLKFTILFTIVILFLFYLKFTNFKFSLNYFPY